MERSRQYVLPLAFLLITCSCVRPTQIETGPAFERDLDTLRGKKIYFAHQSVGANILEGLHEIVPENGPMPDIRESLIGKNGNPAGKCEDFVRNIEQVARQPLDLAVLKFCYIDFDLATDPRTLFGKYSRTIDSLRGQYPRVIFIPATAPLTTRPAAWKLALKALLGRTDTASELDARRAEFNRLLREHYSGQPVFDLARVESTNADGSRNQYNYHGQTAYSLVDSYSSDGGHLNKTGRQLVAREFVHTLAGAVRAKTARVSPL